MGGLGEIGAQWVAKDAPFSPFSAPVNRHELIPPLGVNLRLWKSDLA